MEHLLMSSLNGKDTKLRDPWAGVISIVYDMIKENRELSDYMSETVCDECGGHRLKPQSLAVKIGNKNIADITNCS